MNGRPPHFFWQQKSFPSYLSKISALNLLSELNEYPCFHSSHIHFYVLDLPKRVLPATPGHSSRPKKRTETEILLINNKLETMTIGEKRKKYTRLPMVLNYCQKTSTKEVSPSESNMQNGSAQKVPLLPVR